VQRPERRGLHYPPSQDPEKIFDMSRDSARGSSVGLAIRSLFWTLVLPGFFAFYLPWRLLKPDPPRVDSTSQAQLVAFAFGPASLLGLLLIVVGVALLATCIFEFARSGKGTLSPVDPPRHLVVRGLYRYVRNPMYLSVTTIVFGQVLLTGSRVLLGYWAIWFLVANLFVIGYEEPTLRQRFGASYDEYTRRVGRWIPTFRPYAGQS
jgi:Phospholipid methyltransferase